MTEGDPNLSENRSYSEAVRDSLISDMEDLKKKYGITRPIRFSKTAANLSDPSKPDEIYKIFKGICKNGLKSINPLKNIRVTPAKVPQSLTAIYLYKEAVAYHITAQIQPKYELDGKPRDITLEVVLRLTGVPGGEGTFDLFVKDITPKDQKRVSASNIQSELDASRDNAMEVLAKGLRNPLRGGSPGLGRNNR